MDFLSTTPSLVEILQLLDHTDIPNCNLVNRKIDEVVMKNTCSMPKLKVNMRLSWKVEEEQKKICIVHVRNSYEAFSNGSKFKYILIVFVAEGITALIIGNNYVDRHYKDKDASVSLNHLNQFGDIQGTIRKTYECIVRYAGKIDEIRWFRNNGIEDELSVLFSLVAATCHFNRCYVSAPLPGTWVNVMAEVFGTFRSKCRILEMPQRQVGLRRLVKALDCKSVCMHNPSSGTSLLEDVTEIASWDSFRCYELWVDPRRHIGQIEILLKKWQSGAVSLNGIQLLATDMNGGPTQENLESVLRHMKHMLAGPVYQHHFKEILVERDRDNRVLLIRKFESQRENFDIKEYIISM